jgi:hypothetical protein
LGIIDPRTGERLVQLTSQAGYTETFCGVADVRDGVIYLLSFSGTLWALRHP